MAKALYAGSFDMFTIGHLSVLENAVNLFDKVYVVISTNPAKKRRYTVTSSLDAIKEAVKRFGDKVEVFSTDCSIPAKIALLNGCDYMIRGIRNSMDYDYEEQLAAFNDEFAKNYNAKVKTIYIRAENAVVSSTAINALLKESVDISKYIPYNFDILKPEK